MNDQLQQKLVEILASIQSAAKATGDFALTQLPDIAQSHVLYGRAVFTVGVMVGLICLIVAILSAMAAFKAHKYEGDKFVLVAFISSSISLLFLVANTGSFFLVWLSPKVWLLKELAGLIK